MRLPAGELLVVEGTVLRAYRPENGRAVAVWSLDLGDRVKGLYALTVTQDGAMLYVQRRSGSHHGDPIRSRQLRSSSSRYPPAARWAAYWAAADYRSWNEAAMSWPAGPDYKHPVQNTLVLSGGRETRRVAGFDLDLGPLDTRRDRLVARWPSSRADVSVLAMLDPDTLGILQLRPWTAAVARAVRSCQRPSLQLGSGPAAPRSPRRQARNRGAAVPAEPLDPAEVELIPLSGNERGSGGPRIQAGAAAADGHADAG